MRPIRADTILQMKNMQPQTPIMNTLALLGATVCVTALLYGSVLVGIPNGMSNSSSNLASPAIHTPMATDSLRHIRLRQNLLPHLEFVRVRDTVYVLGDRFVEVSLQTQRLTVRFRNGDTLSLPISSGNPDVKDGMATSTGIFSVQNKTLVALSKQFGNTKMLWWIGFNYNTGFHGLERDSYYRYLGKRPSSHGCLRMAREDVERLYKVMDVGVPVMVYDAAPSRVLAFADSTTFDTQTALRLASRGKILGKIMSKRLDFLHRGQLYVRQPFAVYLDGKTSLRPGGYEIGDEALLTVSQQKPVYAALGFSATPQDYFLVFRRAAYVPLSASVPSVGSSEPDSTHAAGQDSIDQ